MRSWSNDNASWYDNQVDKYCIDCHFSSGCIEKTGKCAACNDKDKWKNRYKPIDN